MRLEFQRGMKKAVLILFSGALLVLFFQGLRESDETFDANKLKDLLDYSPWYTSLTDSAGLSKAALYSAHQRYSSMCTADSNLNDTLLTIIDFSKPSSEERLFIIDIKNQKLLKRSLVAHGQNSGELFAKKFSNKPSSHMSSLGMYITDITYEGKHGYSLRLKGVDKGFNDKAYERAIVIHGANYVSTTYIEQVGRIGRSFGCPALSKDDNQIVIDLIKGGSCLYIYHPSVVKN